jgi:hypothetical protein
MNGVVRTSAASISPAAPASSTQQIAGVDDFNGDYRNDLVLWDSATGAVEFWLMNGTNRIGAAVPIAGAPTLATNWRLSATADFDHDNKPDLVWRNITSQKLVVWTMNGTTKAGSIIPLPDQAVDFNWELVAALDLNADGNADFLWYNQTSGKIVFWTMNASVQRITGSFTTPANAGDNGWKVLAAGDYGVGPGGLPNTADIVWRNTTSGKFVVWYMDTTGVRTAGTFTTPDAPAAPATDWTIVGPK